MATKDNDYVEHLFVASSHSYMLFFTDKGQVFKERVFHLPAGSRQSRGKPLNNVIPLDPKEKLAMVLAVREFSEGNSILFVTAQGKVKKTDLMAYSKVRSTGIRAITLADDDRLIAVRATNGSEHIMLATKKCKVIRFDESDARQMGRGASGVRGIKLKEESDEVVGCITFNPEDDEQISVMTITEYGHGKRTPLNQFRLQRRGGSGIIGIRPRMRNGDVVGIILIESEEDEYLVVTNQGVIMRGRANAVRVIGRNTSGVKLMRVPKGASVVSIARYAAAPDEEGDELDGEELIIPEGLESTLENAEYDDEEYDDEGEEEIEEDEDESDED